MMDDLDTNQQISEDFPQFGGKATSPRLVIFSRFIVLAAAVLVAWFGYIYSRGQEGIIPAVAAIILLVSQISPRGFHAIKMILLVTMTINIFSIVSDPYEIVGEAKPPTQVPIYILFFCLLAASVVEVINWFSTSSQSTLAKTAAWGLLLIPALFYIAGIPLFSALMQLFEADAKKIAMRDPDWNWWNESMFRAAKFGVFAAFTYLGACVGSFLNVAAYCIPRGEPIGLRDSKCPKCDTKISRIDNLPIFSYINLGASCRNCKAYIPARYLLVELVVAFIFGSLFLYQLVTGCINIPEMNMSHKGILWIILYPKWEAISIYFYHAFWMSSILVLALMERDRQPLRTGFAIFLTLLFAGVSLLYSPVQPVSVLNHLPVSIGLSPIVDQVLRVVVGAIAGGLAGMVVGRVRPQSRSRVFVFGFLLAGIVVGWQAIVQIALLFAIVSLLIRFVSDLNTKLQSRPTTLLLLVIILHHPFWKLISLLWGMGS